MNVVVTGASRGIGLAIAKKFLQEGNNLIICSKNEASVKKAIQVLEPLKGNSSLDSFVADLSIKSEVESFSNFVLSQFDQVDTLINNAGFFEHGNVYDGEEGILERMLNINLMSAYHLTRAIVPNMIECKAGTIVNLCSIASLHAYAGGGSYSVAKHAMLGLSRNFRSELKEFGIRVVSIMPGAVLTDAWDGVDLPGERFIQAKDIADTIWMSTQVGASATLEEIVIRPTPGDI